MPKKSIYCPNGCSEHQLERIKCSGVSNAKAVRGKARRRLPGVMARYKCDGCGWEAEFTPGKPLKTLYAGDPSEVVAEGVMDREAGESPTNSGEFE